MKPILTADEMRAADARAIVDGIPGSTLMENAGVAVARAIESRFGKERRVAIVCGLGNNGGDGFVVARVLKSDWTRVFVVGAIDTIKGDARIHLDRLRKERSRLPVVEIKDEAAWRAASADFAKASLIVDALLGTGNTGSPRGLAIPVIDSIRERRGNGARVVAVDLPSGLPADGGPIGWKTVEADVTVTLAAKKPALVAQATAEIAGSIAVVAIGIPERALRHSGRGIPLFELEPSDASAAFPRRPLDSHKGRFGHVLVVAGSAGKTGAAVLAARGALRAGAGLVTVASIAEVCRVVSMSQPEAMTESLGEGTECGESAKAAARVLALAEGKSALVIGPGLGRGEKTQEFVLDVVARCPLPVVVDADGLFAIRAQTMARVAQRDGGTILTPHPGEMAHLLSIENAAVQTDRIKAAIRAMADTRSTVVLKGHQTIVATRKGEILLNPTGSPSLATAGTGDVLAGVLGAIIARGVAPDAAAAAGVFVHGLAGERAGKRRPWGTIAGDVADAIPAAIASLRR